MKNDPSTKSSTAIVNHRISRVTALAMAERFALKKPKKIQIGKTMSTENYVDRHSQWMADVSVLRAYVDPDDLVAFDRTAGYKT